MGCRMYLRNGHDISVIGKPSTIAAVGYTFQYLCREVDRIADEAWENVGRWEAREGIRSWKNSFRLGASATIHQRLTADKEARAAAIPAQRESQAMVLVRQDEQAVEVFAKRLNLRTGRAPSVSAVGAYRHGQVAGQGVALGGGGRAALGAPAKRIRAA